MKYLLLIYIDDAMLDALPPGQFDSMMRNCISHADELQSDGCLIESQQLEAVSTAKSIRNRGGRLTITDGPFAEAKEVLGGFNLIEAENMDEAVRIAESFPWSKIGCVEVRPVRDMGAVRQRVGMRERVSAV
ncbi:MAG TPA: YciI family protein [Gemmatimonadaceae bacterium]